MSEINTVLKSCDSTNLILKKECEKGAPDRSWISSEIQTQGRGRLGRHWISEKGNLFFSVLLKNISKDHLSWIPHFSSVLLCESLLELNPNLEIQIKWPNDVGTFKDGKFQKGAGILCEGVFSSSQSNVVVGIGVNCKTEIITDRETVCFKVDENKLRECLISKFQNLNLHSDLEVIALKQKYYDLSLFKTSQKCEWFSLSQPDHLESGTFMDFGKFGELIVKDQHDQIKSLYSEEIKIKI